MLVPLDSVGKIFGKKKCAQVFAASSFIPRVQKIVVPGYMKTEAENVSIFAAEFSGEKHGTSMPMYHAPCIPRASSVHNFP